MNKRIAVPYFNNEELELTFEHDRPEYHVALGNFLTLTTADRLHDSRHVYAYYKHIHHEIGGEDWLDDEMGIPALPEEIWTNVWAGPIHVTNNFEPDTNIYVMMEGRCTWYSHGLMLVWKNGECLTKVDEYTGSPANNSAFGIDDAVYNCYMEEFRTRLSD